MLVESASTPHHRHATSVVTCSWWFETEPSWKELTRRPGRGDQEAGFVKQDHQQQRQQRDRGEVERDGDGLVIAAVEQMRREVQPDERQAEDRERTRDALDRVIPAVRDEVEEAAADQQERAEIERDLRVRQRAALDDPVVVSRVERAIARCEPLRLVRVDQPQPQPLGDLLEVRRASRLPSVDA